jgi:hypothetical protein
MACRKKSQLVLTALEYPLTQNLSGANRDLGLIHLIARSFQILFGIREIRNSVFLLLGQKWPCTRAPQPARRHSCFLTLFPSEIENIL